jgi:amidase
MLWPWHGSWTKSGPAREVGVHEAQSFVEDLALIPNDGPRHGISLLVKDNIATKDSLDVSAGSYGPLGAKPANESSVVSKHRGAGIVILGKTNLSEWANF